MIRSASVSFPARLGAGLAGSVALTAANALGHRLLSESPRVDVLGMRAIVRGLRAAGSGPPLGRAIRRGALAGDLTLNALLFALGVGGRAGRVGLLRGLGVGAAAGVAAAALAPRLGLNERQGYRSGRRMALASLYVLGGLVAGAALRRRMHP